MSIFDVLPVVNRCCCCFPLKIGTLVLLISMFVITGIEIFYESYELLPAVCGDSDSLIAKIVYYAIRIGFIFDAMFIIGAIIFIIGVFFDYRTGAEIFLYALLVCFIMGIVGMIFSIVAATTDKSCANFIYSNMGYNIAGLLLFFYIMVLVRSCKEEM